MYLIFKPNGVPASGFAVNLATGANAVDTAAAVRATIDGLKGALPEGALVSVEATGAEASALMSDRLELKCTLRITGSAARTQPVTVVEDVETAEGQPGRSGILVVWPQAGDTAWSIGERHRIAQAVIGAAEPGKPIVLRV